MVGVFISYALNLQKTTKLIIWNSHLDSVSMKLPPVFSEACERHLIPPSGHCFFINVEQQQLTHYYGQNTKTFTVSTSINGTGQKNGSYQTPLGLHKIHDKFGAGEPIGTVFKGRKPIRQDGKGDPTALITDRILWLEGLEPGINLGDSIDSRKRYIYIHGIGDESSLGKPNSQGCIHLAASDLLPLFEATPIETLVYISEN